MGESGRIREQNLEYLRDGNVEWSLPLTSLLLVGERTTPGGPTEVDHFVVLLTSDMIYEAPLYTEENAFELLSEHFGVSLQYRLCNSGQHASRVAWPPNFSEREIFSYSTGSHGSSLVARMREYFSPLSTFSVADSLLSDLGLSSSDQTGST